MLASNRAVYATETYSDIDTFDSKTAIIFAHQDDDLLWMLPWWGRSVHIVLGGLPTTPGYIDLIDRQQDFLNKQTSPIIDYQSIWEHPWDPPITDHEYAQYYWGNTLPYPGFDLDYLVAFWFDGDATITRTQVDRIKDKLRPYMGDINRIVTHNNWGEYGHQHHRAVNQACRELAVEYQIDVWVLGSKLIDAVFHDLVPCDVPYTVGFFDSDLFYGIRNLYLGTSIDNGNAWTGGAFDPSGYHRFVKVVDQGNDLSVTSDCLRKAYFDVLGPDTLVSGDFDGDNNQTDFAATDRNQSIWVRIASTGVWTKVPGELDVIVTGDFNTDGVTDLAGIDSLSGGIYYTTDLTTWTNIPGYLSSMVAGDFDGDGQTDLAGIDGPNHEIWYTTDLATWSQVSGALDSLVVGDFNGDGNSDLAGINNATHNVYYTTDMASLTQISGQRVSLVAGDFDGNGKADLASIDASQNVSYTLNLASWTSITGQQFGSLVAGDFNNDGHADLAGLTAGSGTSHTISKTTNLSTWVTVPGELTVMISGDFNNDGSADLAGINYVNYSVWYTTNLSSWTKIH
jgi:hypothetical protein